MEGKNKISKVMKEFKSGELHSGKSERLVTNKKQAIAIALSEARKSGSDIPKSKRAKQMKAIKSQR